MGPLAGKPSWTRGERRGKRAGGREPRPPHADLRGEVFYFLSLLGLPCQQTGFSCCIGSARGFPILASLPRSGAQELQQAERGIGQRDTRPRDAVIAERRDLAERYTPHRGPGRVTLERHGGNGGHPEPGRDEAPHE